MTATVRPGLLSGTLPAVSSKSHAHRVMIAAALSDRPTELYLNCISKDIAATAACIRALGGDAIPTETGYRISPVRRPFPTDTMPVLHCGESGSTARFLMPVAAAVCTRSLFTGEGRLPQRPFAPLCEAMAANGISCDRETLPMRLSGKLRAGTFEIDGNISSQYISGLLFALPLLEAESEILLRTPLESSGYVDLTVSVLKDFGITVHGTDRGFRVPGGQRYRGKPSVQIEGDWSNAAFWLVASAIGAPIRIDGLNPDSCQRDKQILPLIQMTRECGCFRADVRDIPDLVPILAVLACSGKGVSVMENAGRLRLKESDRLLAVAEMIRNLGGTAEEQTDRLIITGTGSLRGGSVNSYNDHRIAMAAAVASILCKEPVSVLDAGAVAKSYPHFFEDFKKLGGQVYGV